MDLAIVDDAGGLAALGEDWDRLLRRNGPHDLQRTHAWIRLWWSCYGAGRELRVLTARRQGELVGVAPLMVAPSKVDGVRELTFIGQDPLDYSDWLVPDDRTRLLAEMLGYLLERRDWDRFELFELPEDSPNLPALRAAAAAAGCSAVAEVCSECPYVSVEGDWNAYYTARRAKLRADLRRREGLLERLGRLRFARLQRPDDPELSRTLEAVRAVNRAHFAKRGLQNLEKSPAKVRYVAGVVDLLCATDTLDLSALWLDERLLAYNLGYRYAGTLSYWNTGFDPAFSRFAPAKLLLRALLQSAFDEGTRTVDLLRGVEPYKFEWATGARKNYALRFTQR